MLWIPKFRMNFKMQVVFSGVRPSRYYIFLCNFNERTKKKKKKLLSNSILFLFYFKENLGWAGPAKGRINIFFFFRFLVHFFYFLPFVVVCFCRIRESRKGGLNFALTKATQNSIHLAWKEWNCPIFLSANLKFCFLSNFCVLFTLVISILNGYCKIDD